MGIKSNRRSESYYNYFGDSGKEAATAAPIPVGYTEATGGNISDYEISGTYYRTHVFTSSGTFAVTTAGSTDAEYVVIGGGGGGGGAQGGGGGAG